MAEVLVVGAGVAGSSAAIHLARKGHDVRLVDRSTFPRSKPCGEGLFPRGVEALAELGVLEEVAQSARVIESVCLHLDGRVAQAPVGSSRAPALGVRREVLDAALLRAAERSGALFSPGVTVKGLLRGGAGYAGVAAADGDLEATFIIAADGLRSRLRKLAGLDAPRSTRRYGVSAHFGWPSTLEPAVHIALTPQYEVYVTPVGERLCNVALLLRAPAARGLSGSLPELYCRLVMQSGLVPSEARLTGRPLAIGPFPAASRRGWRDNLLLLGDAAGFFDGISGEGMSIALSSSRDAAAAVDACLAGKGPRALQAFERRRRRLARSSTLLARFSLFLASHPDIGSRIVANLGRRPQTLEKLYGINAGLEGWRSLRPRDLSSLLLGH